MNDRNREVVAAGDSMSVTKINGTTPDNEGREGSVGLMALLPASTDSYTGGTNGAMDGVSMADLKNGYTALDGRTTPDNTNNLFGEDNSGEVDQRKPWNDPDRGFLTRPMGNER